MAWRLRWAVRRESVVTGMHAAQEKVVDRYGGGGVADRGAPATLCWMVRHVAPWRMRRPPCSAPPVTRGCRGGGEKGGECGKHAWARGARFSGDQKRAALHGHAHGGSDHRSGRARSGINTYLSSPCSK